MPTEFASFAAGCFWGIEAAFSKVPCVLKTEVGYMGGHTENPSYREVCREDTGHAEVVQIKYDPTQVSYKDLLQLFWELHDPTSFHRQGPDSGSQYRSAIFYHTPEQKLIAEQSLMQLEQTGRYSAKIVTEIAPASTFYKAEEYHQHYIEKQGLQGCGLKG
ncbi:MAG: peptide-methionine (S)-S-oxide reductase MsrA [Gammaproteobacteria bacterium]|nr:peptide-methionine (S)-S-oxide reductase MsrA [Gammaproteobacteria bacterium]